MTSNVSGSGQQQRRGPAIFISHSADELLAPFVKAVHYAVRRLEVSVFCPEVNIPPSNAPSSDVWRETMRMLGFTRCAVFLVGWDYGPIPEGEARSLAHLEYEQAKALALPRFVYLMDAAPSNYDGAADQYARILSFRNELLSENQCAYFGKPTELAARVSTALALFLGLPVPTAPPRDPAPVVDTLESMRTPAHDTLISPIPDLSRERLLCRSARTPVESSDLVAEMVNSAAGSPSQTKLHEGKSSDLERRVAHILQDHLNHLSPASPPGHNARMLRRWRERMQADSLLPPDPESQSPDRGAESIQIHRLTGDERSRSRQMRFAWLLRARLSGTLARNAKAAHPHETPDDPPIVHTTLISRAHVELLLLAHEDGKGPIDWDDARQWDRAGLDLRSADLARCDLHGLPLACVRARVLQEANLEGAHLERADLRGAHLEGANLKGVHLEGADLEGVHLEGADLRGAHLETADLSGAHLEQADLHGAYFAETIFIGAVFEHTQLDEDLDDAIFADEPENEERIREAVLATNRQPRSKPTLPGETPPDTAPDAGNNAQPVGTMLDRRRNPGTSHARAQQTRNVPSSEETAPTAGAVVARQTIKPSAQHEQAGALPFDPTNYWGRLVNLIERHTADLTRARAFHQTLAPEDVPSDRVSLVHHLMGVHAMVQGLAMSLSVLWRKASDGTITPQEAIQTAQMRVADTLDFLRTYGAPPYDAQQHYDLTSPLPVATELGRLLTIAQRFASELSTLIGAPQSMTPLTHDLLESLPPSTPVPGSRPNKTRKHVTR